MLKYLVFLLSTIFTLGLFGLGYGLGRWRSDRREAKLSIFFGLILRIIPIILFLIILAFVSFPIGNIWQGIASLVGVIILVWFAIWLLIGRKKEVLAQTQQ